MSEGQPDVRPRTRSAIERLEVVAAILLAAATVATAWSSYQATRWSGEQAKESARANNLRIESTRAEGRSNTLGSIDVSTFTEWVNARATGDAELMSFYETRFRAEFKPAFNAWIATDPFGNANAPETPFQMSEYVRADALAAAQLSAGADLSVGRALEYMQHASNYVLCVVLFAAALFFAGLSTRFSLPWARRAVLIVGTLVFIATFAWLATFPVSFAI
jgi:hypothetical protein